jgi:chemotaxis signal transduction protein
MGIKMKELLFFQVGTMQLGMDLPPVTSIQGAPSSVAKQSKGPKRFTPVVDGKDTPLYNLLSILGEDNLSANPQNEKLILVKTRNRQVGLIVDRVDRVVTVDSDRIESLSPIFKGAARSCFPKVLKHEDRLVLLLSPEGIVKFAQEMQKTQDLRNGLDIETDLPPTDIEKALKAADTEVETQMPPADTSRDQDADWEHLEGTVNGMLQDDQLAAKIERAAAEMISKAGIADTVQRLFTQAVEGLHSQMMK